MFNSLPYSFEFLTNSKTIKRIEIIDQLENYWTANPKVYEKIKKPATFRSVFEFSARACCISVYWRKADKQIPYLVIVLVPHPLGFEKIAVTQYINSDKFVKLHRGY